AAMYNPHSSSAATGNGFDYDGIADLLCYRDTFLFRVDRIFAAWKHRQSKPVHLATSSCLIPHQSNCIGRRSDKFDAAGLADSSEISALGKKSVAWMNRVRVRQFGSTDHAWNIEVTVRTPGGAHTYCFVRKSHVKSVAVRLRKHSNGLDTELFAGQNY